MRSGVALIALFALVGCGDDVKYCPGATEPIQPNLPCCFGTVVGGAPCTVGQRCSDYDSFEGFNCDCPMGTWTCHGHGYTDMAVPRIADLTLSPAD